MPSMSGLLTGLIAAGIVFVILFVIISIPLWISFIAAAVAWVLVGAFTGGAMHRSAAH